MSGDYIRTDAENVLMEIVTNIENIEQQQNKVLLMNSKICRNVDRKKAIYLNLLDLLMESNPNCDLNLKSSPDTVQMAIQDLVKSSIKALDTYESKVLFLEKEVELIEKDLEQVLQKQMEIVSGKE